MLTQNLGGQRKSIMVFSEVVYCKLCIEKFPVCVWPTYFTSYRRVTHVECVFRRFVGNGGNWTSLKKIEPTFIFNKISVQKYGGPQGQFSNIYSSRTIYIPVQQYTFQYNNIHSSTTINIPLQQYTFQCNNIHSSTTIYIPAQQYKFFSSDTKSAFAKNYLKAPIISHKRGKSLIKGYAC